ncbi:MAG: Inner membrane protein YhaI [Prochlorococcus marinus str. MIT 9215]|nr:MAG: Inner membrane protein YhaI [Prochlorococcus marinus str. MIT 9215]
MALLNRYLSFWSQGFDFKGRTKRIDYWTICLINVVLGLFLGLLPEGLYAIYVLFAVASIIPGLAMQIRRIRDTGRQWQWIFIALVPLIGAFWLLWIVIGPSAESSQQG